MSREGRVELYDAQYSRFASELYAQIRAEAFGEDIGQNGWLTADEQDLFVEHLDLAPGSKLLDVACGSGGPTLRIARKTGCDVQGVDIHEQAIEGARARAVRENLKDRARFDRIDGSRPLPFSDASFDGLICVDAINHLPDRPRVLGEWARVLRPGGRLVFTDPIVVTGPLTNEEIAIRSSIGFFIFVPVGVDEQLLEAAGFTVKERSDRTENMARLAGGWRSARESRSRELRRIEGDATFEGQQRFLEVTSRLAAERRLSRFAFLAVRT